MGNLQANFAKGRWVQLYDNVKANVPTGCAFIIAAFTGTETDANLRDADFLSSVEALALAESVQTGYARKVLVAADLATRTTDDTGDVNKFTLPAQSWTLTASGTAWSRVGCFYRPASGSADSAIEFCGIWDFVTAGIAETVTITFPDPVFTAS